MRTPDRSALAANPKPHDDEIDVFGLSHAGKVRAQNQDHFLLATIHKRVQIVQTNLTEQERLPMEDERLAIVAMVADGVGGAEGGEEASATALEVAMQYMARSTDCYYRADGGGRFPILPVPRRRAHPDHARSDHRPGPARPGHLHARDGRAVAIFQCALERDWRRRGHARRHADALGLEGGPSHVYRRTDETRTR